MAKIYRERNEPGGRRGESDGQERNMRANLPHRIWLTGLSFRAKLPKEKLRAIDTDAAEKSPGVIKVMTHENTPKFFSKENPQNPKDESFYALQSDKIYFDRQPLALVVAETFEQARYAARLVKITYEEEKPTTDTLKILDHGVCAESRTRFQTARQSGGSI